ncbi:MAG: AAA family ATPase [Alphaproteobacteria bacterium]|nr:AAA family ATPase [Alphaproteobacteria bacterium]
MFIAELRLSGFKSFVDHVRAPIEPGLTGVVGPNGCGKSNLLEAVRWAMGSTSAKSMRADDMDSVIFSGSAARPAREHAEVTLVLKDALGRAPGALGKDDTLEISRRIRRGLGSTYRINGKDVRAKDVQLLFADASTGANSPALVRQGQVSELIAAKPENRRRILEEAAGIAGLHARRHEADLKLRAAEANLARLDEVVAEIDAQLASLKKQARQAERYRGLAAAIRETEALLLHRRWMEARAAVAAVDGDHRAAERLVAEAATHAAAAAQAAEAARERLPPLREEEAIAGAVLRRLEGVRVGHERDLRDAEERRARAEADLVRLNDDSQRLIALKEDCDAAAARLEAERAALPGEDTFAEDLNAADAEAGAREAERADAETRLEALAAENAARLARARALSETADAARARLARLAERRAAAQSALAALPNEETFAPAIAAARDAADAAQRASAAARAALAKAETALKTSEAEDEAAWSAARAADAAFDELNAEVRALERLAPPPSGKAFPPVLGEIQVADGYERALAAALGDDLEASRKMGAPLRWTGAAAPEIDWPAGVHPLTDHVEAPRELAARLALIGVVDADAGHALQKSLQPGARLVSLAGDLWRWDGFVRAAAAPAPAAARLEQRNRLRAARKELSAASDRADRAKAAADAARAKRRAAEETARSARQAAPLLAQKAGDAARAHDAALAEAARSVEQRVALSTQRAELEAEYAAAEADAAFAAAAVAGAPEAGEDALAAARAVVAETRTRAADARAAHAGLARERDARVARRAAIDAELQQWRTRRDAAAQRIDAVEIELDRVRAQRDDAVHAPDAARAALAGLLDEQRAAEARRTRAADAVAEAERVAREADAAVRSAERAHAEARETRAAADARLAGARERLADSETQAREIAGRAPDDLAGAAGNLISSALATGPISDVERKLDRLRAERDSAGPVNLRAHEEMQEAQARLDTLNTEKEDVAAGVTKLRRAIGQLNAEGRARLLAAFETVNENFAKLFTALFEGGQAKLTLTENDDPLAAGLEIMAQPPGKKLTTLSLMSGGEQALTATALIFAVFLANPAPICVLDEVDAPLDDANVDRYCRMLDEMKKLTATRFLVITHNPVTMARVDRLYGVTMAEPGLSQLVSVDLGRAKALAAVV